jgi:hypothetical protein
MSGLSGFPRIRERWRNCERYFAFPTTATEGVHFGLRLDSSNRFYDGAVRVTL